MNERLQRGSTFVAILIVGLWLGAGWVLADSPLDSGTILRCDPITVGGTVGEALSLDVYVENVTDLYGGEVRLSFDHTIAQVVDADPGRSGTQIEPLSSFLSPDLVVYKEADNGRGTIRYAVTQLEPHDPVTGSGSLARVAFEALQAGSFNVAFTYQKLGTRDGEVIPVTTQDCTVSFSAPDCYDFDAGTVPGIDDVAVVASRWRDSSRYDPLYDVAPSPPDHVINISDVMTVASQVGQPCPTE